MYTPKTQIACTTVASDQSLLKCRSRAAGHSACLKGMLRTITMQGLTLADIVALTGSAAVTQMCDNRHRILSHWF